MQLIKQTGGDHREGLASGKIFRFSARKGNHGDLADDIGDYYCLFSKLEVSCLLFLWFFFPPGWFGCALTCFFWNFLCEAAERCSDLWGWCWKCRWKGIDVNVIWNGLWYTPFFLRVWKLTDVTAGLLDVDVLYWYFYPYVCTVTRAHMEQIDMGESVWQEEWICDLCKLVFKD